MARRNKLGKPMTLEESARRMTALLARAPKSKRTCAYLESLPKRKKVVVSPADYPAPPAPPAVPTRRQKRAEDLAHIRAVEARLDGRPRRDRMRPKARRGPADEPMLLEKIAFIQHGRCVHCARGLEFGTHPVTADLFPTFEHVIPRALGGMNVGNRLAAHRRCNMRKGDSRPTACELVWLLAVNARLGVQPQRF